MAILASCAALTLVAGPARANPDGSAPIPGGHANATHDSTTHGTTGGLTPNHAAPKEPIGAGGTHGSIIEPHPPGGPGQEHAPASPISEHDAGKPSDGRPGADPHSLPHPSTTPEPVPTPTPTPPRSAGGSPGNAPVYADTGQQFKSSMAAADRIQQALRVSGEASTAWNSLKRVYNKVMGNPRLPEHFGQQQALTPHLQDVLQRSGGSFIDALRTNLGDLDRELLRATYDKDYYREPLMGYKPYDKFLQNHGEQASYEQLQKLSPADRLQYLMNFGRQSRNEKAAAQQLENDLRALQSHNAQLAELEAARNTARKQTQAALVIYDHVLQKTIDEARRALADATDDDFLPSEPGKQTGGSHGDTTPPKDPAGKDQGNPNSAQGNPGPSQGNGGTPGKPTVTPSDRRQDAIDAVTRHQIVWEATRKANPDLYSRLSSAYDRAMGNVTLPATFNDPKSLPDHLQTLLAQSGGYENAMRADIGDLDRELLRATFDRTYYQEPLMGYASYAKFMAKYGDRATAAQIQKLSPPDRLQYLLNHGQQSADEIAAAQARARDYQFAQQSNAQMGVLQQLRDEMRKQAAVYNGSFNELASQAIRDARKIIDDGDDDEQ